MAPEQVQGAAADARTDIFALGTILLQMATGRRAFEAKTQASLIAKILETEPPAVSTLAPLTPPVLDHVVQGCLAKQPGDRWQTAHDVKLELQWIQAEGSRTALLGDASRVSRKHRTWVSWIVATAVFVTGLVAGLGTWWAFNFTPKGIVNPVMRLTMNLQDGLSGDLRIQLGRPFIPLALSPDGARIAWSARGVQGQQLFVRELSEFQARAIPGTEGATTPFFSPDGRWVGFWANGILRRIRCLAAPRLTSAEHRCRVAQSGGHATKSSTKHPSVRCGPFPPKVVSPRKSASARPPRERGWHSTPSYPAEILLVSSVGPSAPRYLEVLSRKTGERRRIMRGGTSYVARYLRTGHLVYGDADSVFAVAVDSERLDPVGAPVPVIQGIHNIYGRFSSIALSDAGKVAYLPAARVQEAELVWLDRRARHSASRGTRQLPFSLSALPGRSGGGRHAR